MFSLNVEIVEVSVRSFTGVANIAFDDQSYRTKIAVLPSIDLTGNFPCVVNIYPSILGFRVAWQAKILFYSSVLIGSCRSIWVSIFPNAVLILSSVLMITYFVLFM